MEKDILKHINDLRVRQMAKCGIIGHRVIYEEALDDLTKVLYGDDEKTKVLIQEIDKAYKKQMSKKFRNGAITATIFFMIIMMLM